MILPEYVRIKLEEINSKLNGSKLARSREKLTQNYKSSSGTNASLISSSNDSLTYALCRMPATYAVLYSLINSLKEQGLIKGIETAFDIGSGTGSGYFALCENFSNVKIDLFERDANMISAFKMLCNKEVAKFDITSSKPSCNADLVMSSYVLSEMTEQSKNLAFQNMLDCSNKYVLIVDTGTPKTYEDYLKLIPLAKNNGYSVIAPCCCNPCLLKNDYCQFYARVERSASLKNAKSGSLSYEDEKYFYLLFEKTDKLAVINGDRVIRRPIYKPNIVELTLCTTDGVKKEIFTKKRKELYKQAKKLKINELLRRNDEV